MPYEIPQNLRYEEKIVFGLTFPQLVWVGLFGGLSAVVFLKATILPEIARYAVSAVLAGIGIGFAFLRFGSHFSALWTYKNSIHEAGYFSERANSFVGVKKVESGAICMKDGSLRAVVQVLPMNFSMLSSQEQNAIISAYRDFLNSLDFPVQIVMRTVNLSLDSYLQELAAGNLPETGGL